MFNHSNKLCKYIRLYFLVKVNFHIVLDPQEWTESVGRYMVYSFYIFLSFLAKLLLFVFM